MTDTIKLVTCKKEGCKNKEFLNFYCKKHQICIFYDETICSGKIPCKNYIRGCRNQLDADYCKKKCESCLKEENEKSKLRRENIKKIIENIPEDSDIRICSHCKKEKIKEEFIGEKNNITKSCKQCREKYKENDKKKDKERRKELARISERKPERKAKKKLWELSNPDKVEQKNKKYRANKIVEDVNNYLEKNAKNMKEWRIKNPEKVKEINNSNKSNVNYNYNVYKRTAYIKGLEFNIDKVFFENIIKNKCEYCGDVSNENFNGIDRKNQLLGYNENNCVSCCKMCNLLKGCLDLTTFIKRVFHILYFQNKIQNYYFYPECFSDGLKQSFIEYKKRAISKNIDFLLSNEDYNNISSNNCYICNKENSSINQNGIDRINNDESYSMHNCKACCRECNYMKKNFVLEDVFNKFIKIYNIWNSIELPQMEMQNIILLKNNNKINKDILLKNKEIKKEKKIENAKNFLESIL